MKKVLIVFNHPAPYKVRLFNKLSKFFDLHVIFERSAASDRNCKFYSEKKYEFTTHEIKGIKIGRENFISSGIVKHLRKNKYDLIIMNGYSTFAEMHAIDYLKKNKIPYLFYINGGIQKSSESFIKTKIKRHFISGAKAYLSPDKSSNDYLIHYGAIESEIYNYPYSTIFEKEILKTPINKEELRTTLNINFDKVFVSVGQLIKRKNYVSLVREWAKFPVNYGLFLIGDGKQREEIEKIIYTNNLKNVVLLGYKTRTDMFEYFHAADAFLFPSKEDIYGHVINESFSQGLPVVSTNKVNSATNLIKDGINGYLLDDLKGPTFREAVEKIISKNTFNNCIETALKNTIELMAECHVKIIDEVIDK